MKYTEILESNFDETTGKYKITDINGKIIKDDKANLKKVMKPGEWLYTKSDGETVTMGQDEEEIGEFFVTGRLPKSYKTFKSFNDAYNYWIKTYRK
jgi:hypothetical protein